VVWLPARHSVRSTLAYMAMAALVVAVLALVISGLSMAYTRRNTHAAEAADRRARTRSSTPQPPPRPAVGHCWDSRQAERAADQRGGGAGAEQARAREAARKEPDLER